MRTLLWTLGNCSSFDSFANYLGERPGEEWDCLLTQNRDSDCLSRSNFRSALKELGGESESIEVHRFGHWACGWWEALAVKQGTPEHAIALQIEQRIYGYPVVDDDDFSELESEEADDIWRNCYWESERVDYIREHRSQFEFHSFADLLGCVRGKYFAGYASELLS
mgnify:CR=1 FL=1